MGKGNTGQARAEKERRKQEAEERNAAYQAKPFKDKLKGAGKKQTEKLMWKQKEQMQKEVQT